MSDLGTYRSKVNNKVQGLTDIVRNAPGKTADERTKAAMKYVVLARENGEYEKIGHELMANNNRKLLIDNRRKDDICMEYEELGI